MKPDIAIETKGEEKKYIVIDTKWKNIYGNVKNVAMEDLRQMFAYHHYFDAAHCYLLYPGDKKESKGAFTHKSLFSSSDFVSEQKHCGVMVSQVWSRLGGEQRSYLNKNLGEEILGYVFSS